MKYKVFLILTIILSFVYSKVFSQTDWFLDNSRTSINTTLIDSITFTKEANIYFHNLWYKGQIIEKEEIEEGYCYEPKKVQLEYEFCTFEEDGFDCILSNSGNYAILQYTPDSTGFILTIGTLGDGSYSCMSFDTLGYVTGFKTSDNKTYQVIYTPDEIWLFDSEGSVVAEIPYTLFFNEDIDKKERTRAFRSDSYTRTPLYNGLSIFNTIGGYLNNYRQAAGLDLLHSLLKGYGNRYGDLLGKLIKAGFDPKNPLSWLDILDTANDISFFGNASITALDAIKKGVCSFTTPCKVEGLTYYTDVFKNMRARYEELINYSYTLKMSVQTATIPHKEKQSKQINITRDGTYNDFNFDFKELQTLYDYEPSLTLDITIKKYLSPQQIKELKNAVLAINPDATFEDITEPIWYTMNKSCTIYGSPNSLVTGSVSSTVEKVNNVKSTTADIICSFSNVPNGAQCVVSVSREGSDIALTFSGTPGNNSQTVKATGLTVNTKYVATSYITYNGRVYYGLKSVDFTTSGPSGNVLSIDASTITTTSAVAKCSFSGMDSGAECGIIAKSGSQTLTFKASSIDGEQDVSLTGLKPGTHYECWAYVKLSNYYKQFDNSVSFTTKVPGITGTWNCVEEYDWRPFPGAEWQTKTRNYTITLNDDGSMSVKGLEDYIGGSWGYSSSGYFNATAHIIATQTQNTWDRFEGNVDSIENPTTIIGVRYRGNMNQFAYSEDVAGRITMTR